MDESNQQGKKPKTNWRVLKSLEFLMLGVFTLVIVLLEPFMMSGLILICNIDASGISLYILAAAFLIGSILAVMRLTRFGKINKKQMRQGNPSLPVPYRLATLFALFLVLAIAATIDAQLWTYFKDQGPSPTKLSKLFLEMFYGITI